MGCQALWFFSFCQQVVSTVSPQLYLMWPSCSATDVEAQYQGSSAPALVTLGLPGEARGQSTHTYFLLTPALGASENSLVLSAMTIETSPPQRKADRDTAISLIAVTFFPPFFLLLSQLVALSSIQWLKTQTSMSAWTLADLSFAPSISYQALPVFPPEYLWNRASPLPSAGASWLEPMSSHLGYCRSFSWATLPLALLPSNSFSALLSETSS